MNSPSFDPTRRHFFRQACCAAVGTTGMLSALAQLRMIGAVAADSSDVRTRSAAIPGDYRALVCLFLNGGNDANSVLVPTDASSYAAYAAARGLLALDRTKLLPIAPRAYVDGRNFGLHPSMPEVQQLFGAGKIAFVANVGTLVKPTTLADFQSGRALPPQLFSHSDQQIQWMSSVPDQAFTTGWGGRLADMVNALNTNNQISMSITLSGANRFQIADKVTQYAVNSGGVTTLNAGSGQIGGVSPARNNGLRSLTTITQPNLIAAALADTTKHAISDADILSAAVATAPTLATIFPSSPTGNNLKMIARLMAVAPSLGLKRQIFFVQLGGWDLHGGQANGHGPLLAEISKAMGAFYDATVELGVPNQVTTFTASDFGRTLAPNADGTDHGWGNHQWVMGGAVRGGDIYGKMPSLQLNGPDDTGRGRWLPTTSVDEYNATLATWFGVSASNLSTVLPNIGRFAKPNLGFMG